MNEDTISKTKKIATIAIVLGIILYLSKFLRAYFVDNYSALVILGFFAKFRFSIRYTFYIR